MRRFLEGKIKRYLTDLREHIYSGTLPLDTLEIALDREEGPWEKITVGDFWGGPDVRVWLRGSVQVPKEWQGQELLLEINLGEGDLFNERGAEGLIFIQDQPVQAIDLNHSRVRLKPEMYAGGQLEFVIRAWSGLEQEPKRLEQARLCRVEPGAEQFYLRALVTFQTAQVLQDQAYHRESLLNFLDEAINQIDFRAPGSEAFYASARRADELLQSRLAAYKP